MRFQKHLKSIGLLVVCLIIMSINVTPAMAKTSNKKAMELYKEFLSQDSYLYNKTHAFLGAGKKKRKFGVEEKLILSKCRFAVYNLDKSGPKELFVMEQGTTYYYVFTVSNGKVVPVEHGGECTGMEAATYNKALISKSKNAVVYVDELEGGEVILYRMNKGKIRKVQAWTNNYDLENLKHYYNGKRISEAAFEKVYDEFLKSSYFLKTYPNTEANRKKRLK